MGISSQTWQPVSLCGNNLLYATIQSQFNADVLPLPLKINKLTAKWEKGGVSKIVLLLLLHENLRIFSLVLKPCSARFLKLFFALFEIKKKLLPLR